MRPIRTVCKESERLLRLFNALSLERLEQRVDTNPAETILAFCRII